MKETTADNKTVAVRVLIERMKGGEKAPPPAGKRDALAAFAGSAVALCLIGVVHDFCVRSTGLPLIMAPFGASAVLVFGASASPLAQPRNVIGGHIVSALIGVTVFHLVGDSSLLAISLAVPAAIAAMHLTGTLHPPGGATAFVTAAGGAGVHTLGYWYVLAPCAAGSSRWCSWPWWSTICPPTTAIPGSGDRTARPDRGLCAAGVVDAGGPSRVRAADQDRPHP